MPKKYSSLETGFERMNLRRALLVLLGHRARSYQEGRELDEEGLWEEDAEYPHVGPERRRDKRGVDDVEQVVGRCPDEDRERDERYALLPRDGPAGLIPGEGQDPSEPQLAGPLMALM